LAERSPRVRSSDDGRVLAEALTLGASAIRRAMKIANRFTKIHAIDQSPDHEKC
jgi:hypothetical protein